MSEVVLCSQSINAESLKNILGIGNTDINGISCSNPSVINAYTPYTVSKNPSGFDQSVLGQLRPLIVSQELTNLSLSFGGDNVMALADVTSKLQDFNIGLMGASTSVYANRIGGFAGAVKNYQMALMEYRQATKSKSVPNHPAKQKAFNAFKRMQRNFQLRATSRNLAKQGSQRHASNQCNASNQYCPEQQKHRKA